MVRAGEPVDIERASRQAASELSELAAALRADGLDAEAAILEAQGAMATDPELLHGARRRVAGGTPAAEAVVAEAEAAARLLDGLEDELLRARAADVRDVGERIARIVTGDRPPRLERRSVILADDLSPSIAAELDRSLLAGIALEAGSPTAHAAILARTLGIPAVVAVRGLLSATEGASEVAVDGGAGRVLVDLDATESAAFRAAARPADAPAYAATRTAPLQTRDGHRITLAANIGHPDETAAALAAGAEAVGLFRTEFLFMGRSELPTEDEQAEAYAGVLRALGGRQVVVRLLDIGGDKDLPYIDWPREANPFLGMRGIRAARLHPGLIGTQLRAVFRAGAAAGSVPHVLAPMVADRRDVTLYRDLVDSAAERLDRDGLDRAPRLELGIMIEVPSAVMLADQLIGMADFVSIGTNDLTQYLLAADRTNPELAGAQDPMHPAVIRALIAVTAAAVRRGVPVGVCGEMAADPVGAVVLAGLGVDELSMDPSAFDGVRRALGRVSRTDAASAAKASADASSAEAAREAVSRLVRSGEPA